MANASWYRPLARVFCTAFDWLGHSKWVGRRQRSPLPEHLRRQLLTVTPSMGDGLEYRPCSVTLRDGSVNRCVYVQEAGPWFAQWGVDPEDDRGKHGVDIDTVAEIEESPLRLPAHLATRVYEAGESGMGYYVFRLILSDGQALDCVTGDAVDFLDWPTDIVPSFVVDVIPDAPEARISRRRLSNPPYSWCLYDPGRTG